MNNLIAVALGGALGSMGRFMLGAAINKSSTSLIPLGTLSVNVIGSFIIGLVWIVLESRGGDVQFHRHFLMVGLLGGFTTFSAFSLETIQFVQHSQWLAAVGNMAANLIACVVAVAIGIAVGKMITG
ncbi:MAG: CrcB protein [Saprospiraceae bacterium]|jgi:CrcB protein